MTKKIKIFTISDHPLIPSGVGIQTKHVIEGLLKTGKYQVRSIGGAIKHADYRPQKTEKWEDDWIIYPVDGYGDENLIREILDVEKPDALWFMTDPRFYMWLFGMADEIQDRGIPMLYWHVWDEFPVPKFNKPFYDSCNFVGCISKVTFEILKGCGHSDFGYIPHAVDGNIFKPLPPDERLARRKEAFGANADKFILFYNSRNARRKQTSDVVRFLKATLNEVGQDKCFMLMQTSPEDPEGANLIEVCRMLDLKPDQISFSPARVPEEQLALFYNTADVTVCLSNAEGFGLSSLESLMCGTPVISVRTGGLQDQNYDIQTGKQYGVSIFPKTTSYTGSQDIPYIRECRCTDEDILNAYLKMYNLTPEERRKLGDECAAHARKLFDLDTMTATWEKHISRKIAEFKEFGNKNRIKFTKI